MGLAGEGCMDALCEALTIPKDAAPAGGAEGDLAASAEGTRGSSPAVHTASDAATSVVLVALSALTKMLEGGGGDDTGSVMSEVAALMEEAGALSKLEQLQQQHLKSGIRSNAALMLEQHGEAITGAAVARVPALVQQLRSGEELAKATQKLRKVLSVKTSPPVSEAVDAGATPLLLGLLKRQDCWPLVVDAVTALSIICDANNAAHASGIGPSAIPVLVIYQQSCWWEQWACWRVFVVLQMK
jgi:hypothetical protein